VDCPIDFCEVADDVENLADDAVVWHPVPEQVPSQFDKTSMSRNPLGWWNMLSLLSDVSMKTI
jgi:hypothetical protein